MPWDQLSLFHCNSGRDNSLIIYKQRNRQVNHRYKLLLLNTNNQQPTMPLGVESTQIRDFAIDHVKDNNLYIDEPGGEEGQGANLLFTYRVSYKNQDLAELHPELLAVYNKSNTAFPQRLQSAFNNLNRAAMKADPLYVDKSPFFKAPKRGTIAAASTFTVQSANATSDAPVPPPTPSNNTAPALVPPPTPGASTSTEMIPSTPTAPSTPAPTEWQSAMKDVAGLIGSVTKMNADEFAKIRAQREEDRQLALERDAKRQEADEKRWNEADERDAKREEQREEERKEEREAREELREATSTVLKGVDQANAKGDFAIGLGKLAVEQSEYAVKQSNFAVEQVERFEERLQTEVAASVRKQMKGRLNMQHEEEEEEDDDDDDEEEEYNNAKELFKPLVKDDPVLIKMTEGKYNGLICSGILINSTTNFICSLYSPPNNKQILLIPMMERLPPPLMRLTVPVLLWLMRMTTLPLRILKRIPKRTPPPMRPATIPKARESLMMLLLS